MPKCDFNKAPELKNCKKKMGKIIALVLILKKKTEIRHKRTRSVCINCDKG